MPRLPCLLILVFVSACSTPAWYAGMQSAAESECRRQPLGETEQCLARLNRMSYEEYQKQRSGQKP